MDIVPTLYDAVDPQNPEAAPPPPPEPEQDGFDELINLVVSGVLGVALGLLLSMLTFT